MIFRIVATALLVPPIYLVTAVLWRALKDDATAVSPLKALRSPLFITLEILAVVLVAYTAR